MIWVWAAAPPIVLFAISWVIGAGVLGPQHITISAPAIALLAAWAIRHLAPSQVRRIVVVSMVIVSLILGASHRQYTDDWRGAVEYANGLVTDTSTPVLVRSGLVQASRIDWLTDPHRTPVLLAPVEAYPVSGTPVALPYGLSAAERRYLEEEILPIVGSESRFAVVSWSLGDRVLPYLQGRLQPIGFELQQRRTFGSVVVDRVRTRLTGRPFSPPDALTIVRPGFAIGRRPRRLGPRGRHGDNTRSRRHPRSTGTLTSTRARDPSRGPESLEPRDRALVRDPLPERSRDARRVHPGRPGGYSVRSPSMERSSSPTTAAPTGPLTSPRPSAHGSFAVDLKGYGAALLGGIAEARGEFIIMGDADATYDFRAIGPFLERLRPDTTSSWGTGSRAASSRGRCHGSTDASVIRSSPGSVASSSTVR